MSKINLLVGRLFVLATFLLTACSGKDGGIAPSILDGVITPVPDSVLITPNAVTLAVGNSQTFVASGGSGSFTYSIVSGNGSVAITTGVFTAPGAPGTTVVRAIDGSNYADAIVTTVAALQISPTSQSLSLGGTQTFTTTGGVPPITFSLVSGAGSINASSGLFTAAMSPGSSSVRATDSMGNTSTATVNVFSALGISPSSITLAVNNTTTFSAAGGSSPYTFSILSGSGVINASTGVYTASAIAGSVVVRVTDNMGSTADSNVTINSALAIAPTSQTTLINSSISFSASGGVSPYTYSVLSGTGSVNGSSGIYTAPGAIGSDVVRVTDSYGNTSDSNITITSAISISPAAFTLAVTNSRTFSGIGGTPPYSFSKVSGIGAINSSSGSYTAPTSTGSAIVRVSDSLGATADANITVNAALAISPSSQTMGINGSLSFSATGGVLPYVYSITSGGGSINSSTGNFTAPAAPGTTMVRITDNFGNTSNSTVTVTSGLSISPASVTLAVGNSTSFAGANGSTPYVYSIVSGGGSINSSTGAYTAPVGAGSATVRVTDSLSNTATATVTVNAALSISPTSKTLAVNNNFTFTATGGVTPYTYSIVSGGGSINASNGSYTAPATAGAVTIRVTDNLGNISNSTVTVNAALAISPTTGAGTIISVVDTQSFSASGGVSPYSYSIVTGAGSINSSTGLYTASASGTITVRATDSLGNTDDSVLAVNPALTVSPASAYVVVNSDSTISGVDGVPPYTYSIVSGGGSIDSVNGIYTAPAAPTSGTLRTTDAKGHTADTAVTIYNALTMTPSSVTLAINTTQQFTASGGVGLLSYTVYSGTGSVNGTGLYTAPPGAGSAVVRVQDTIGNIVESNVSIVSSLTITPQTLNLPVFSTVTYTAILGSSPYSYSVLSGGGSVVAATGVYTAPATIGAGSVKVTDAATNTSTANVTHIKPVEIASGSYHNCVRYNNGGVKCWGLGSSGQLGQGATTNLGTSAAQMGGALPFVNLGTGRTATSISAGISHTCAILDNATLKCWGSNTYGQLGTGNTTSYGSASGQMGDNLPAVNLGTGRTAVKLFAYGYETCVILDNNATKCFGRNNYGQLGQDDIVTRGTSSSQMGDNLLAINFGSGRTATKLVGGADYTCAQLDNNSVKCFGRANYGQTGYENTTTTGNAAGSMAALAFVNLGTGRSAVDISAFYSHTCAILDNATIKCWGRNQSGQLGNGNTSNLGDGVGEMGDGLPVVPLASFTPTKIWAGRQWSCAGNAAGAVRCWGLNSTGQLLVGSITTLGDNAGEVAALANINFGTGLTVSSMDVGYYSGCAILSNDRIKCFGSAANNDLLNGSTTVHLGDAAGELGDSLPFINH